MRDFSSQHEPEFCRVNDAVRIFALSKAKLYQLINEGKIRSVALRQRGQIKGTRLINIASLRAYLDRHATGGEPSSPPAA